jgi:hypothetical protein
MLVVAALVITGCASTKEMLTQPPRRLDADPATRGVVVLDVHLEDPGAGNLDLIGAHIRGDWPDAPDIYAARFEVAFETFGVMFQGVPPGHYRLTQLVSSEMNYNANMKTQTSNLRGWTVADSSAVFDVNGGALTYVGHLSAIARKGNAGIGRVGRPMRERTVLLALQRKYPDSGWDSVIRRRVAEIEAGESAQAWRTGGDVRKLFDFVVMNEHLGSFSRRAGPLSAGDTLIVTREGIEYRGRKHALTVRASQLRAVRRLERWVEVEYDIDGARKRVWFGHGGSIDSEPIDAIELAISGVLRNAVGAKPGGG